jgi:iron complex outermembrane receptor protein
MSRNLKSVRVARLVRHAGLLLALCVATFPSSAQQQLASAGDLSRLSIEELAKIRITSVSRTEEPLNQAAAAVYVITDEAIRRSGATTLPEILRLAPNLHVARIDANTYGISARGFNQGSGTANKLLVLIDGRAIYSPLFSGTFWDAQKTFLDDIDRIEVISGPGGTLWGGNAVNGVINIITKNAIRTRGIAVESHLGTLDRRVSARFGDSLGAFGSYRVYGLAMTQGALVRPDGDDSGDDWNHLQGGFRADWSHAGDSVTFQGDAYRGTGIGLPGVESSGEISGANLSATWDRELAENTTARLQAYADTSNRVLVSGIDATVHQFAIEGQTTFARGRHSFVAGAGYRRTEDRFEPGPGTVYLDPAGRNLGFANAFIQDAISISDRVRLSIGTKLEHNTYSGFEWMPDVRVSWARTDSQMFWAAVGRAVRTPSRFDTDLINTGILDGGPDFDSEDLLAYEVGYRALVTRALSLSVSAFYNHYDRLRTVEATGPAVFPLVVANGMRGTTQGLEAWGELSARPWWRVMAGVALLDKDLSLAPGSRDVFGIGFAGNDPGHQWMLRSNFDLPRDLALDASLRGVGELDAPHVDAYVEADARVAWQPNGQFELALIGRNLLHARHVEFVNTALGVREVPRSLALGVRWTR